MADIKSRLNKLEQKRNSTEGLIEVTTLDFFYGDPSATVTMTRREFEKRAARGLAGFYEDIAKREAETTQADAPTNQTKGITQ